MSILYAATGGSGHEMIDWTAGNDNDITALATLADGSDDKVINAYTAKRWSNCDVISLMFNVPKGTDTIGTWVSNWTASGASRVGWLFSKDLYHILSDNTIEVTPIFDIRNSEVVSLYAYRIDDDVMGYSVATPVSNPQSEGLYERSGSYPNYTYTLSTDTTIASGKTYYKREPGGAVAFKLSSKIRTSGGVKIGLNLKHQRINYNEFSVM